MSKSMIAIPLALAFAVAGCSQTTGGPGPAESIGTLGGAVGGALVGTTIGAGTGNVAAIVAGTVIGGFLGNRIGNAIDQATQQRAYAAQVDAVESGNHTAWQSGGYNGYVDAGPVTTSGQGECRQYTHTIYIGGQPRRGHGIACRNPDGTWRIVS